MKKLWILIPIIIIILLALIFINSVKNSSYKKALTIAIENCEKKYPNKQDCVELNNKIYSSITKGNHVNFAGKPIQFTKQNQKVLWVGAHPDDEAGWGGPILGKLCRDLNGDCTLLVGKAPSGEGKCFLPKGCPKNPAEFNKLRTIEAKKSAALYNADIIFEYDFNERPGFDTPLQQALNIWHQYAAPLNDLIENKKKHIERIQPDIIIISDPRFGDYCHPEHRLHGWLTIQALESANLNKKPKVYMTQGYGFPRVESDHTLIYDASEPSKFTGKDTWEFLIINSKIYQIPIDPTAVEEFKKYPEWRRKYFLLEYDENFNPADPIFNICLDNLADLRIPN
jgi:LmbE family N-acetylglucosaminyl deacetylase